MLFQGQENNLPVGHVDCCYSYSCCYSPFLRVYLVPDSICDIDKSHTFDRRAHQYSDGLRDVPGVNLNSHVKGVKRLLMAEAGTKPGPCAALGPKWHLGPKRRLLQGSGPLELTTPFLLGLRNTQRTNLWFAEPQILVQGPLYYCFIFLHRKQKCLVSLS